jgi:glycosyltransferase involved in cell wall biosynthesis
MSGALLVCDVSVPQPSRDTASLRLWRLLMILRSEGWQLAFHPLEGPVPAISAGRLRDEGVEVLEPGVEAVVEHLENRAPDVVLVSRPQVGEHVVPLVRKHAAAAAIVYDTLELTHVHAFRYAKATGNRGVMREAVRFKAVELELAREADVTLVVTELERSRLAEAVPEAELAVVSSIHTGGDRSPAPLSERRPEIVLAAYWPQPANQHIARILIEDIWPTLARHDPELRLILVGIDPPEWLGVAASGSGGRIVLTGHVIDVAPYLDSAWCSLVPQPFGSGVKGKVLTPLSHGLPTVATSIAWEGIPVVDGVHGLIADDPEAMVDAVLRLRSDTELWDTLQAGGPELIEQHFSFAAARAAIVDALERARDRAAARA